MTQPLVPIRMLEGPLHQRRRAGWVGFLLLCLLAPGCPAKESAQSTQTATPSTPRSETDAAAGGPPAEAPAKPWFVGTWQGVYQASKLNPIEGRNAGQQMAWIRDKGQRFTGEGQVELVVDDEGRAKGSALGPLGAARIQGVVDERGAMLRWIPEQDGLDAFSGTLVGDREADGLKLRLSAASGDGKWIRGGEAKLHRAASR